MQCAQSAKKAMSGNSFKGDFLSSCVLGDGMAQCSPGGSIQTPTWVRHHERLVTYLISQYSTGPTKPSFYAALGIKPGACLKDFFFLPGVAVVDDVMRSLAV
jgi:hypothetical protein